jgi:predicted HNH restriction endonuclease
VAYKGSSCQLCGYSKSIRALQFHHLIAGEKDFNISRVSKSWQTIKKELDKCILLCSNCHAEVHDGLVSLILQNK